MKTTRTHIPSSEKNLRFSGGHFVYCPSLLLGSQIKNFCHISNSVSTTTNQLNSLLLSDSVASSFSKVLLHKLLLPQRVNRFTASFEAQRFITVCTKEPNVPIPSQMNAVYLLPITFLRYILISSFHLCLGLPSCILPLLLPITCRL